jgi:hypothetical protein
MKHPTLNQTKSSRIRGLAVFVICLAVQTSPAAVVTLQPVADAYLSNGGEADQTLNTATLAQFGYYGAIKRPLLMFDLSSIPDSAAVTSAQLTLQRTGSYGGDGYFTALSRMTNDNWLETTVTWNSYNQTNAVVVATLPSEINNLRTWQISLAQWAFAEDLADDAVTFMLRWDVDIYGGTETDAVYKANDYSSKEGSTPPTLRIEYTTTVPASPQLMITRSNKAVIVSWPLPADGWVLEWTNTLSQVSASWPQIPPPYQTNGANLQFTEPSPTGTEFYRLHKP